MRKAAHLDGWVARNDIAASIATRVRDLAIFPYLLSSGMPTAEQGARPPSHPGQPTKLQGAAPWGSGTQRHEGIVTSLSYNNKRHKTYTTNQHDARYRTYYPNIIPYRYHKHTPPRGHTATILTQKHYYTITRPLRVLELTL